MKHKLLAIIFAGACSCAHAEDFCTRLPMDPDFPAGMDGRYELVGRDPVTGTSYSGSMALSSGKSVYALTRTVNGKSTQGKAWLEQCSPDKIMVLAVRYYTKPVTLAACVFRTDVGNYYRISCKTHQSQRQTQGLEAWFQRQ